MHLVGFISATLLVFYCFYKIVADCTDNITGKPDDMVWWPEKQQSLI